MSIIKLLNKKLDRTIFTTPSHNQKAYFSKNLQEFYKNDMSEYVGYDNLSCPKSAILMAQGKIGDILGAKQSFFVTQGATTAMLAAMKAIINPGDRILAARNCHKCVFNGLILTAGIVDWFMPETNEQWGIYTEINTEKLDKTLAMNNYKAFILTSPTYEGVNSDIEKISQICKKHNTYLIVDEAHGALYGFNSKLPKNAISQGADISINSLHKTAGGLNQTAILNVGYNIKNMDIELFQQSLNLFHTTSPSYPLLSNIEACITYLFSYKADKDISNLISEIEKFKKELKRFGIEFFEAPNHDVTKILLKKQGISGGELSESLFDEFQIEDELNNNTASLFLTGIGTTKNKLDKLKSALKKIKTNESFEPELNEFQPHPLVKLQPVDTFNRDYMYINKNKSLFKISNRLLMPYPPGIGILYPGEAIQEWHLKYLSEDVDVICS
ncbi:MAG: aminotransferase class I/II-fold pyridoxal phosphate-dependent enzyme [Candidatus Gastranaerophilales bacterium]|nr:aminotransferase class I/II-fold pyridoxal phosphate-dependent enzyme [Candidatus Gastranaerophilales bacterium]